MSNTRRNQQRIAPLSTWDRIDGGMRAIVFTLPLVSLVYICYRAFGTLRAVTLPFNWLVFFYVMLLLTYVLNGIIASWLARESYKKAPRKSGFVGERVASNEPNYIIRGVIAGICMAILILIMYFSASTLAEDTMPFLHLLSMNGIVATLIDALVAIGCGAVGGLVYDKVLK